MDRLEPFTRSSDESRGVVMTITSPISVRSIIRCVLIGIGVWLGIHLAVFLDGACMTNCIDACRFC